MTNRIVIADDDRSNLKMAERILTFNGYEVICLSSGEELLDYVEKDHADLILLDVHMEGIDGFETMKRLMRSKTGRNIPVIFLTADDDSDTETKALLAGAMDFVGKPFVASVLLMRVRHTLELIRLQSDLKAEVSERTKEALAEHEKNERLSLQVVQTLAGTIDAKDTYTNGHSARVAKYAKEIARRYGFTEKDQEEIYMMGLLHDVGKIGVEDTIINKKSKLTDTEYDKIKEHPVVGYKILKNITEMPKLAIGARWHHERYDGNGYPDGLKGEDIPTEARIIAVADAYDAMSSKRSYHSIYAQEFIRNELMSCKGTQFDPVFADIMLEIIDEDKDYLLRELEAQTAAGTASLETGDDDMVFTFLSTLEAGGINTAIGMKYCVNDVDFYIEMLSEFTSGSGERKLTLDNALKERNWEKYRIHVHSLKSSARTIGAAALSELAKSIEKEAANANETYVINNHASLIAMLKSVHSSVLMALAITGHSGL